MNKHVGVYIKLHKDNDRSIIDKLSKVDNKQGYIKGLIKKDIYINNQYKKGENHG